MKKIYTGIMLLLAMLFLTNKSNAQSFNYFYIQDSCSSTPLTTLLYTSITQAGANQSIIIFWGDGSSDTTNLLAAQSAMNKQHIYSTAGTYTVMGVLVKNGSPLDTFITSTTINCSYITIRTYADVNNNCVFNTNEPYVFLPVSIEVDSAGVVIDTISGFSNIWYKGLAGVLYKFKLLSTFTGVSATCPSNGIVTITAPSSGANATVDFGYQCNSSSQYDLGLTLWGYFRPIGTSRLRILAYNNGCSVQNGVVTVQLNNKYVYKSASIAPASVSGNTISWNVSNLSNYYPNYTIIDLYADTATGANVNLGDTICNSATITPTSGDVNTANNSIYQCDSVRASWDPNDKHVYPAGDIDPGTKLTYTINFENLGNDTAFNIYIMDTLSNRLDAGSLQVLNSSHAASQVMLDGPGGQKIVRFDFKDIHLPDKNSPDFNKGFVQFSINVKNGLAPSTPISNRAGIYFDINPVVITNYTENRIKPVSVNDVAISNQVTVYPNPVTHILTIQMNNGGYDILRLLNNIGRVVANQSISGNTMNINMANLPTGIYYLQLTGKDNTITQKIEKH